ncbi:MAG: hypothetical protein EBQ95_07870 [Gammaproteobacteria bacterium]|nr:hypothetical protein [Gammaproteobacteria bacterium]
MEAIIISLSNLFFDEYKLHKRIVKCKDNLQPLRENFIQSFFKDMDKRNPSLFVLAERLNAYPFSEYPILQAQYLYLFSLNSHLPRIVPEETHQSTTLFHTINQHFGYFNSHQRELGYLFHRLVNACRKLILLHEKTDDKEAPLYAYKIMAIFCEKESPHTLRFSFIANQVLQFLSGGTSNTPYHAAWLTMLHDLPFREELMDFSGWRALFKQYRMNALYYFSDAKNLETLNGGGAPKSLDIAQALLKKHKYKRAAEDTVFAEICRKKVIPEETFEKGLNFIQRGWPRKKSDDLPNVRVLINNGEYVWLKLPPQDKRALILGRYIPGCCQIIGSAAGFCVEQGIALSSHGFYVLLKQKTDVEAAEPIIGDEINEMNFKIVAQSYAWLSLDNNLCLDSIERDCSKVSNDIIKLALDGFAESVYQACPNIKHIHVGSGGQTPFNLFPEALRTEKVKEGRQYPDSLDQCCVANQMPQVLRDQMLHLLSSYPPKIQERVMFVIPYFSLEEQLMAPSRLALLIKQIKKQKLNYILAKKSLKWSDFSPITLEEYEQSPVQDQMRVSTLQKLLNAETDEMALAWMKTIPIQEYEDIFDFKQLKKDSYWFRFARCMNAHLLIEVISKMEMATRQNMLEITALFSVENVLGHLRDLKRYGILIKLIGLCVPEVRFTLFKRYLYGGYLTDFFVDQHIVYILELVAMIPDAERVKLLKCLMLAGCLSESMGYFFERVSTQLTFEQFFEFMTFKIRYLKDKPVWRICYIFHEVFEHVICSYSEAQRQMFFEDIGMFNFLIRHEEYHHFARFISILSLSHQVKYIWDKRYLIYFVQENMFDELHALMHHFPHEIQLEFQNARPIYLEIYAKLKLVKSLCVDFKTSIHFEVETLLKDYRHHRIDRSELLTHITLLLQEKLNELKSAMLTKPTFFQDEKLIYARLQDLDEGLKKQLSDQNTPGFNSASK